MAKHSKIGASSAYRWFKCPASINYIDQLLDAGEIQLTTSKYAEEGTKAHDLAESLLKSYLEHGTYEIGEHDDPEMFTHVETYVDEIVSVIEERLVLKEDVYVEEKFHLPWIDKDAFGSNDACLINKDLKEIYVFDLKYGAGIPVEVENNSQLLYYALGAFNLYREAKKVHLCIIQPRAEHPDGAVRYWSISTEELKEFNNLLKEKVAATKEPNAKFKSGKHCRFCPALPVCTTAREKALEVAKTQFGDVTGKLQLPTVQNLSDEDILNVLDHSTQIRDWINAVEKHALKKAMNGGLPTKKVITKYGHRKWKNVKEVEKAFGSEAFQEPKLKSPAQLQKLKGVNKELVNSLCEKPISGYSLVDESDSRPAIAGKSATDEFKPLKLT